MSVYSSVLDGEVGIRSEITQATTRSLKVLAYVHLRNIYGSTGAGRTARQITEHLAQRSDLDVRILADANDMERILPLVQHPWTSYRYYPFTRDTSRQQAGWFFFDYPRAESYWPESDIVFCTGESYVPVNKARLIMTAHDAGYFEPGAHIRDSKYWKTRLKWELLYNKLDRKVDMFHTVSQFSAERLAHFFPNIRNRIRAVYNGVTPHFYGPVDPSGTQYVRDAGLAETPFVLVPGGLHFRKNAELILDAIPVLLHRFPTLIIVIVNHTNLGYATKARALSPRVKLLGFVSDEALHALYTTATVVWYPSRYEGFGLPVVEAMACGASVVASNSSSIPEIAGKAATLVDPGKPAAHADAISGLLEDPQSRAHFSQLGKERAAKFTWSQSAAELKKHFEALV